MYITIACGAALCLCSILYGKYVKGPTNTVRIHASAGQNDIPAARAVLHKVDGVIVPKK